MELFMFKCYEFLVSRDSANADSIRRFFTNLITGVDGIVRSSSSAANTYYYVSTRRGNVSFCPRNYTREDIAKFVDDADLEREIRDRAVVVNTTTTTTSSSNTTTSTTTGHVNNNQQEWNEVKRHDKNRFLEHYVLNYVNGSYATKRLAKSALLLAFVLKLINTDSVNFDNNAVRRINAKIFGFDFTI